MSLNKFAFAAGLIAVCAVVARPGWAGTYSIQTIDDPNGVNGTMPSGINNSGQIVGIYMDSSSNTHGFVYTGGTFSDYTVAGSNTIYLSYGINNLGAVVGNYSGTHGFLESGGIVTTIDDPSAAGGTFARGVNDSTEVAGYYLNAGGGATAFTDIGGTYSDVLVTGSIETRLYGVNTAGTVVGYFTDAPNRQDGFTRQPSGSVQAFDEPNGHLKTQAFGINDAADIVGDYTDVNGVTHGFVEIGQVYTTIDGPGAVATEALGINNAGDIVGFYQTPDNAVHGFVATPVPEPATSALWIGGLVVVAFRRRGAIKRTG